MMIAIIVLIFVSFFFSGSETALTAANKVKLKTESRKGDPRAKKLVKLLDKPREFITTILIANNSANIVLPTLVTIYAVDHGWNVGIASAIITVVVIIISEVIPKSVAATYPDAISRIVYPVIHLFVVILSPITKVLNALTGLINKMLINDRFQAQKMSKEEVRTMVAIAGTQGAFNEYERNRLQSVMEFDQLKVNDVDTTPRVNVTAFSIDTPYDEVYKIIMSHPYTRYPVYDEDIDDIVGVFHSKYLLIWSRQHNKTLRDFISEPLFVNEHNKAEWVMRKMIASRKHIAIVLDEYGGTDAIITMEDLIEQLLGLDIEDEMDQREQNMVEQRLKNKNKQIKGKK
ncbi:hemolysin [Staphylococcus carnosus]|uniref:hemolysin family protein n=1 Tax=Staphylococcus carnosus TaxID=1281 RepID=UPI0006ABD18D|nr:CNNM domain-containing protein [Staphylococcus carnosus]KOR14100.1 hemolysin [Staphylococcus carnosus]UTB81275.1 hemolysin [Staphylococcus carnosus]